MKYKKLKTAMSVAEAVSNDSHDIETQVGCVLVKKDSGAIVGTGFNGFIRNAPDDLLPNAGANKHMYIQHAEKNLMSNCLREGISAKGCVVICTLSPCPDCTRFLWQCGITEVYCSKLHKSFIDVKLMNDLKVKEENIGIYYKLTYYQ